MIIDKVRDLNELRNLYSGRPMPEQYDFDFLVNNPNLFCFYDDFSGKLLGFITIQRENNLLTLSGTSIPKNYDNIVEAIRIICEQFNENIYAFTPLKNAALVLIRAGFTKIKDGEYVKYMV